MNSGLDIAFGDAAVNHLLTRRLFVSLNRLVWRSETQGNFFMNELGAFSSFAAFGFACTDDVRVLVLESSLVQFSVVDVESMGHLGNSSRVARVNVSLSNVLWLLLVQLSRNRMKQTRLVWPCKACRYTRLVEDALTLPSGL